MATDLTDELKILVAKTPQICQKPKRDLPRGRCSGLLATRYIRLTIGRNESLATFDETGVQIRRRERSKELFRSLIAALLPVSLIQIKVEQRSKTRHIGN